MNCSSHCIPCLVARQAEIAAGIPDEDKRRAYLCEAMHIIADYAPKYPAPVVFGRLTLIYPKYFDTVDLYTEVKHKYNLFMLDREAAIRERIDASADPLRTAVLYARAGNYIDFGAMHAVDDAVLERILTGADSEPLDTELFERLRRELAGAKTVTLIADNCGEIILDKLLLGTIRRLYPDAELSILVKQKPALNDATVEDALEAGLDTVAEVVGNGITYGIPGTWLPELDEPSRTLLERSDVVLSKGQANFETLGGCGLNIFYLLMCKCQRFVEMTGQPLLSGLLLREGCIDFI